MFTTDDELKSHIEAYHTNNAKAANKHCNFCEEMFNTLGELMKHNKKEQSEKVYDCWNFAAGVCDFDDQTCWFNHNLKRKTFSTLFQCKACDKTFTIRTQF